MWRSAVCAIGLLAMLALHAGSVRAEPQLRGSWDVKLMYDTSVDESLVCYNRFNFPFDERGLRLFLDLTVGNLGDEELDASLLPPIFSDPHGHLHSPLSTLIEVTNLETGELVQLDKQYFCIIDLDLILNRYAGQDEHTSCDNQGLSPGWADDYIPFTPGQSIPLEEGLFLVRLTAFPELIEGHPESEPTLIDILGRPDLRPSNNDGSFLLTMCRSEAEIDGALDYLAAQGLRAGAETILAEGNVIFCDERAGSDVPPQQFNLTCGGDIRIVKLD